MSNNTLPRCRRFESGYDGQNNNMIIKYALLENGMVHTSDLTIDEANEMLERHARIFDTITWEILPMSEVAGLEVMEGYLEKQRRIAILKSDL